MNQNQSMQPIRNESDLDSYESYLDSDRNGNWPNGMAVAENRPLQKEHTGNGNMSLIPANNQYVPEALSNTAFMPAFLSKHIGKLVKVELLLCNQLVTRVGILMTVGAGFIVLRQSGSSNTLMCDLYSIKFVTIIHNNDPNSLFQN